MRIIIIGTVLFSYRVLQKLVNMKANVVGVCTKKESKYNNDYADLTPLCEENNIPYFFINNVNDKDSIDWIKSLNPDVIFCVGLSQLIKKEILCIPSKCVIGYHPTLLPKNRGRHPIIWALALGLTETGSTFFIMDEGADSGDVLSQKIVSIEYTDDAKSLYDKLDNCALQQIECFLPTLVDGSYKDYLIKQSRYDSNTWRKRDVSDGVIDFRMTSRAIYNLVRALTVPYVGAHVEYKGNNIKIWKVQEVILSSEYLNYEPGKVLCIEDRYIIVKSYDNGIKILEHEFETLPVIGEYL